MTYHSLCRYLQINFPDTQIIEKATVIDQSKLTDLASLLVERSASSRQIESVVRMSFESRVIHGPIYHFNSHEES